MEFIKIKSIETKKYSGKVYDLSIEKDHTYTINGYSVHNSAAGSLVNYLLEITDVDPIKHDLLFERFLDPAREDMPDIDIDFEPRIRDDVIDYMVERFGRENTANIGTYGVLKVKSAIQDAARVFGIPAKETMGVTKYIAASDEESLEDVEANNPKLQEYFDKWAQNGYDLRYYVRGMMGSVRQPSMHAAGLLVSSINLFENIALMKAKKGVITAWQEGNMGRELSDQGYAKMDILGLNNLQVMNDAARLVKERHDVEINWEEIDLNEPEVYEHIIKPADMYGVFQFEASFVVSMVKNIKPRNFEQFAAISALLRPGPLHMGMDKEFARRLNGEPDENGNVWSEEDIPEPIQDILAPTLGIIVYQEQVMKIAEKIGGFTVKETNKLRKDLTKGGKKYDSDPEVRKNIDKHKKQFLKEAKNHIGEKEAENMWELLFSFSKYGFNKSHSISYTFISFYEAWLKYHYNAEFNVALLNNTSPKKEKKGESIMAAYLTEIIKGGYTIHQPNVNNSDWDFTLSENGQEIYWGLAWVKNLTKDSISSIVKERKENGSFESIDDFYDRMGKKILNKKVFDALTWSGALDDFIDGEDIEDRFSLHQYIYSALRKDRNYSISDTSVDTLIEKEIESNNISLTEIKEFAKLKKNREDLTGTEYQFLYEAEEEGTHFCIGKVINVERKKTRTNKDYKRIALKDESSMLRNVYVWPWKCSDWDSILEGQVITARIMNDGNFRNLLSYSLIKDRSTTIIEKEKEQERQLHQEAEEKKKKENEKIKEFTKTVDEISKLWNKFEVKKKINKNMKMPYITVSSEYATLSFLIYRFTGSLPRKDIVSMKEYDGIYMVDESSFKLYEVKKFLNELKEIKSVNRVKTINLNDFIPETSPDVYENRLV